jgi:quinol monooxygenase YgiN
MKAYNVVRFRVKPGREQDFIEQNRKMADRKMKGFLGGALVKTGERTYCLMGEWENFDAIVAARPEMISILDTFRDTLEDLGGDLGVTDPVSGEAVLEIPPST